MTSDKDLVETIDGLVKLRDETVKFYVSLLKRVDDPRIARELQELIREETEKFELTREMMRMMRRAR